MNNINFYELDRRHHLHPSTPIKNNFDNGPLAVMEKGEGIYLYDIDGKKYIDGLSSLWNVNIGHGRKELAEVAEKQMSQLAYSHSFNGLTHKNAVLLAEKVASLAPGDLNVCHFTSGGSESNDTVFKLIRHYFKLKGKPEKYKIIARERAYHGISMGATSATGIPMFREMGGPLAEGFVHVKAPYCYRCVDCEPECHCECAIDSMIQKIKQEGPETIAAIIVEPIQGAGGVIVPPQGYLKRVREICDEYGILLVADEVITGFGRTGKWFGMEHDQVVPDFMTIAKGITSGYIPLGGVVVSDRIHKDLVSISNEFSPLPHGYTYSGHPTACAVALRNIEIMERENLVQNSYEMGHYLKAGLERVMENSPIIGNVMAKGLIASVELVEDKDSKKSFDPSKRVAAQVFGAAFKKGLITRGIAFNGTDIIALCPPLIINKEQINQTLDILESAIQDVHKQLLQKQ